MGPERPTEPDAGSEPFHLDIFKHYREHQCLLNLCSWVTNIVHKKQAPLIGGREFRQGKEKKSRAPPGPQLGSMVI